MKNLLKIIEQYNKLKLDEIVDYNKFNDFAITTHSTQIEGSTLSIEETALLLNEGITPKGKPLDHSLMVKDHYFALKLIHEISRKDLIITPILLQRINAATMKSTGGIYNTPLGIVDSSKGEYRKGSVYVQDRYFPEYSKVPSLVKDLCDQVNNMISSVTSLEDKIRLAYSAHFNLVSIHPFYDGNGRTSRLLMNLIQEHFKIPLSVVYREDKLEYYQSLEKSREHESLDPIITFMSNQHQKFLKNEIQLYQKQNKKDSGFSFLF